MNIFPCVTFLEKIYNSILYKLRFKNSTLYKSSLNYSALYKIQVKLFNLYLVQNFQYIGKIRYKSHILSTAIVHVWVKLTKILVDLTLIRQGNVIHILTRKKMVLDDHHLICVLIYMKNYKESKIYNIIKCGILIYS